MQKKNNNNLFTTEREPLASPATAPVKTCTALAHMRLPASGLPGCEIAALNQTYNRQHVKISISQPFMKTVHQCPVISVWTVETQSASDW